MTTILNPRGRPDNVTTWNDRPNKTGCRNSLVLQDGSDNWFLCSLLMKILYRTLFVRNAACC